ncbi:hypothetical protein CC86DRAFT_461844 [Ophiobolus disseminans]|uniref:Extracellular membrane protein CFEM domain-containing protein n=1 Tax=Ophiobolus disseminans TaxID=1469910 RepID=A0A6A7AJL4_9PLEO|nr:hypothetical protein CC86DRAFT_461844 [Ophiobolus disseminans]
MRSSLALLAFFAHLFALRVVAHKDYWQINLQKCWRDCFGKTEDGCSSSSCVCNTSQDSDSYLPNVVSCAVSSCPADVWATQLVVGPLQLICLALNSPIPDDTMDAAYAAASKPSKSTGRPAATSSKTTEHKTSNGGDDDQKLTTTIKSTLTRTTTDSSGNTLVVFVPVMIGPAGVFTGAMSTSTLTGRATPSNVPSSVAASPSPSAAASSLTPTQLPPSSTAAAGTQRPNNPQGGNGSPFENMQAAASKWAVSGPLLGLGALALLFMRI